jgi:curved DNA-binding protein CbpA
LDERIDPYQVLQVDPRAEAPVIQAAYRALMKQHHPDRGGDPAIARKLSAAYAMLRDPRSRRAYDGHAARPAAREAHAPAPAATATPPPVLVELGPALLSRFAPVTNRGPGWLFDFAGALRDAPRHRIWVRRFHRRDVADAKALLVMVDATRLARPMWLWSSDLFVAVVSGLTDPFARVLRTPQGPFAAFGYGVVALEPGRLHAAPGRPTPSMRALGEVVRALR